MICISHLSYLIYLFILDTNFRRCKAPQTFRHNMKIENSDGNKEYNGKNITGKKWQNTKIIRWKIIFFFHSGTNRKHNIIYKLTYTIIINNLHKFSWAFCRYKKIVCFRSGVARSKSLRRQASSVPCRTEEGEMSSRFEIVFGFLQN